MTAMEAKIYLAAAGLVLLLGLALWGRGLYVLRRLEIMVRRAADGTWRESTWDESRLSKLEAALARVLTTGALSRRRLDEEQNKIKRLVSDISHQTKTPLANILLYTELLGEKPLTDDCRELTQEIGRQGEKLRFLVDALVKTSRLESGIVQVIPKMGPVRPMLDELAAAWRPAAQAKGLELTLQAGPDFDTCFDPKWTAEAIGNLLDNAVKYTGSGGSISITAQPFSLFCRITVTDTGVGLSENERAQVFERFYRAPAAAGVQGVGLGLYLARQIVSMQGGYLRIQSQPGKGTAVSVFLPRGPVSKN